MHTKKCTRWNHRNILYRPVNRNAEFLVTRRSSVTCRWSKNSKHITTRKKSKLLSEIMEEYILHVLNLQRFAKVNGLVWSVPQKKSGLDYLLVDNQLNSTVDALIIYEPTIFCPLRCTTKIQLIPPPTPTTRCNVTKNQKRKAECNRRVIGRSRKNRSAKRRGYNIIITITKTIHKRLKITKRWTIFAKKEMLYRNKIWKRKLESIVASNKMTKIISLSFLMITISGYWESYRNGTYSINSLISSCYWHINQERKKIHSVNSQKSLN